MGRKICTVAIFVIALFSQMARSEPKAATWDNVRRAYLAARDGIPPQPAVATESLRHYRVLTQ